VEYLEWGVWFADADVKSYAGPGAGSTDGAFAASAGRGETGVTGAGAGLAKTATYEGDAHGLSTFRASTAGEDPEPVRSGHFTADVELKATFDNTSPTLEGMIDNFQGDAVNTGWKIEIDGDLNGGTTVAKGRFTNQTYGESGQRPTGIVGTFGRNFTDGAVDGVYHAK